MLNTRNLLALVALVGVVLLVGLSREHTSPGPLASVHAREGLGGPEACARCHGDADAGVPMSAACAECHPLIHEQVLAARGLHGALDPVLADDCAHCHGEHGGADFALVSDTSFARAGWSSTEEFDHAGLAFTLTGEHAALRCERCHEQATVALLPRGAPRFLGLEQRCAACHEDPHDEVYGQDCAACHGQARPFAEMDGFEHQTFCPLVGAHASVECRTCHEPGTPWSVAELVRRPGELTGTERDCASCHVSPHREAFLSAALPDAVRPGDACATCHSAEHPGFLGDVDGATRGRHEATGFALAAPHAELECAACHPDFGRRTPMNSSVDPLGGGSDLVERSAFLADFPGREADSCVDCHGDPHLAQFDEGPFVGSTCLDCHDRHGFSPSTFDVAKHARADFALQGAHAEADCSACHVGPGAAEPAERAAARFDAAPAECAACHATPHSDDYLGAVATSLGLSAARETCARCHDAEHEGFPGQHGELAASSHAATGFELVAPHAAVACADCHAGFGERKFAGSDEGLAAAAGPASASRGAFDAAYPGRRPERCDQCHEDPHAGQFERAAIARTSCLDCHARDDFLPSAFGEAQHATTTFALQGAHRAVSCNACHRKPGEALLAGSAVDGMLAFAPPVSGGTARVFVGTPTDCAACHTDVHAGEFDAAGLPAVVDGRESCARCHGVESFAEFGAGLFDHERWTSYALDGAHAAADCKACHVPRRVPDENGRSFGRAPGRECTACHAVDGLAPGLPVEDSR